MRSGLYHCEFSAGFVILDLVPDRYRLLKGEGASRFARLVEGQASRDDIAWLTQHGIERAAINPTPELLTPVQSAIEQTSGKAPRLLTVKACWLQLGYRRRLKYRPLCDLLETLAVNRPTSHGVDSRMMEIAWAFERSKHFILAQDQCLPRALAMTHMLFGVGIDAQLIFGVTMPFAAHCWVQRGDTVLSDRLDRVLPFRPIMALS